jgi:peptidyl-tRNA hydrolase, PTH1 family
MKLIVGLGNPGGSYARNRHNVGFMAVDRIAARHHFGPWKKKFSGLVSDGKIAGERVLLLKPETYMNESGTAVGAAARYLKISSNDILVFYDEIDLAPGKLKVKTGGGNAGHNGLRSLSTHIDNDYVRVRIGIGHPGHKDLVVGYVLHDFAKTDAAWLEPLLDAIATAVGRLVVGDRARFLTDVAQAPAAHGDRRTAGAGGVGCKCSASGEEVKLASSSGVSRMREEPATRRAGLADNIRRWLARRSSKEN